MGVLMSVCTDGCGSELQTGDVAITKSARTTNRNSDDAADVAQKKERIKILIIHHNKHVKEMVSSRQRDSKFTVSATMYFKTDRSRGKVFVICGIHTRAGIAREAPSLGPTTS